VALSASADSDEAAGAIAQGEINVLLRKAAHDDADRVQILELLTELGLRASDEGNAFVMLRQNRGQLVRRGQDDTVEVVARGRGDWVGSVELKTEAVNEISTQNTARVIKEVDADILAVIEAESPFVARLLARVAAAGRRSALRAHDADRGQRRPWHRRRSVDQGGLCV
jgi:hypothetical protein